MPADVLDRMIQFLTAEKRGEKGVGFKHDSPGGGGVTPPQTGYMHGPGGLLTFPGVDPDVYHTIVGFRPSLMSQLPSIGTVYINPVFEVLTGIKAGSGDEPTAMCGPAPIGGLLKGTKITAPFGYYKRDTREFNVQRMGQRINRSDPMDLTIVGSTGGTTQWSDSTFNQGNILTNELDTIMFERAVEFDRLFRRQIWTGNPSNNHADGTYKEFAGLQKQINTGYRDAETAVAMPALDSQLGDFNYKRVDGFGTDLVNALQQTWHNAQDMADRTGMQPVRFIYAMRPALFYELTKIWPCAYFTTLCTLGPGNTTDYRQNIDLADQINMRDDMRSGHYLMIEGTRVDVLLDDGIPEYSQTTGGHVASGCFYSDIFLIPMSVLGGSRATLYLEYFNYTNPSIQGLLSNPMVLGRATANGAFFETSLQTHGCFVFQAEIQPRLIFRTPWLAARLQNVAYCPISQPRQPFPTDPYFVDGGETSRPGPSLWQPWA